MYTRARAILGTHARIHVSNARTPASIVSERKRALLTAISNATLPSRLAGTHMDQEHIIKRTPHKLSAARNEAGAEAPAGGQKTRGCIEGEEPGFEFRSFLLGAHVGLHACARRRHAHPPRARRQQRYADINASFTEPCIYTHLHLHTRTHTCLQTHTHAHIYTNTHTHIYLSIYPYRSIYISFSLSLSPPSLFLALSLSLYIYIYIYNIYEHIFT